MRIYPKSAEAWALEMAQALGLGPGALDVLARAATAFRAEGEQIGDDARAMFAAYEVERPALLAMKNEALRDLATACAQRDEAATTAHGAAVGAARIIGAWLLARADEFGFANAHLLVSLAMQVSNAEPLRDYADGKLGPGLFKRIDEMRPLEPRPPAPPLACTYCQAPTDGMVPTCRSCGLGDNPEEERTS